MADKREPKVILCISLILTALGCGTMLLFSTQTPLWLLMTSLGLLGFGLGGNGTILMKIALSGLSPAQAGAVTGTYGLFRDLAAPFGVAVFVPFFTNRISDLLAVKETAATAAVRSIHALAAVEIICVCVGIAVVLCLPKAGKNNQ